MGEFRVYLDDELQCRTTSPVLAQAAWHRASRDGMVAERGGFVRALEGEVVVAQMHPEPRIGHEWPDGRDHQADLRDVWDSLILLLQQQGWDHQQLAQVLTDFGLHTRDLHGVVKDEVGGRTIPSAAEIVVLLNAVQAARRDEDHPVEPGL